MDNNIDEQIQKLEQLKKLYTSEDFEQHNAFGIAIIEELKTMLVSKNESLHDVSCCTHDDTVHQNIRCNVCKDCGYIVEIDV